MSDPVISSIDADGNLHEMYRLHSEPRCQSKGFLEGGRCEGTKGHKGPHWRYNGRGWLLQWVTGKCQDLGPNIASASTPPGHASYIQPLEMNKRCPKVTSIPVKRPKKRKLPKNELAVIKRRSRRHV